MAIFWQEGVARDFPERFAHYHVHRSRNCSSQQRDGQLLLSCQRELLANTPGGSHRDSNFQRNQKRGEGVLPVETRKQRVHCMEKERN